MNTKAILSFLGDIAKNNDREWFSANRNRYEAVKKDFEEGVSLAISRIVELDPSVAHITVADATYRFYRDTRFSPDKSPYKRHLGAYVAAHGKKALHGGYYMHLQPGECMLACGCYYLPTNILTACRNEMMANIDEWLSRVTAPAFIKMFGEPGESNADHGFGLSMLKSCPSGFPRDYEHLRYLRMKDYCCWVNVPDDFFEGTGWLDQMMEVFATAKPMLDFVNAVIDDYE